MSQEGASRNGTISKKLIFSDGARPSSLRYSSYGSSGSLNDTQGVSQGHLNETHGVGQDHLSDTWCRSRSSSQGHLELLPQILSIFHQTLKVM